MAQFPLRVHCRRAERLFGHGFFDEPRWILDQCLENWVELYPPKHNQICCGGGGGALTSGYDKERRFYGRKKMEQIKSTGAEMVIDPCHSCHGQFNSLKEECDMGDLEVKYLWELVAHTLFME